MGQRTLRAQLIACIAVFAVSGSLIVGCVATADIDEGSITETLVRKDAKDLSAQEKADFVGAINTLKTSPSVSDGRVTNKYDAFVAEHLSKLICWTSDPHQGGYGHNGPTLLTWHRALLIEFEQELSEVAGKPIAIPYWDWSDQASTDAVFADDLMGPGGDPENGYAVMSGPFKKGDWNIEVNGFTTHNPAQREYIVRAIGTMSDATEPPTAEQMQQALLRPDYDAAPWSTASDANVSFRQYMDGTDSSGQGCVDGMLTSFDVSGDSRLHGSGHMWVGGIDADGNLGTLGDTATSPNDPVFWLHHAAVDRMLEAWWVTHDYAYAPMKGGLHGDNFDDVMDPFGLTNGDMVKPTEAFGYRYDTLPSAEGGELDTVSVSDGVGSGHAGHGAASTG